MAITKFLRYPGGKAKLLSFLINYLPKNTDIQGNYIEPFVGGGSVFLHINPSSATISDLNTELINLYKGIKLYPHKVWETFKSFPAGKANYYKIRDEEPNTNTLYFKAARTLYLNRTCFKGMWRYNALSNFNVGYGGEERRWVITHQNIVTLSRTLKNTTIFNKDYEEVIEQASINDFIFLDPPYKPGEKDLYEAHYINGRFLYSEQERLADCLHSIPKTKRVKWALTNSAHPDILRLYKKCNIIKIPIGTSNRPGIRIKNPKEVLITNY